MRENRLRWFEHAMRGEETGTEKVVMRMNIENEEDQKRDGQYN